MSFIGISVGGAVAAGVGAVGNAIGSEIQAGAARGAAQTQAQAASEATALQRQMYDQGREDLSGYRDAGSQALSQLSDPNLAKQFQYQDFEFKEDPGYAFRMQEGEKALARSQSAGGRLGGGRAMKELSRYGQGLASQEYGKSYDRYLSGRDRAFQDFSTAQGRRMSQLTGIAGMGQQAASQTARAGQQFGISAGANIVGAGDAMGAGQTAAAGQYGPMANSLGKLGMQAATSIFSKKGT